ncbi:hypothetical protein ACFVFQ_31345 [Streptomyces sp. NPDC057743]|uniref:hypothetical protein n=1 Tax=Streptomyces sp. NPDC057743 TaxID=3346236 RepID=UPI0036C3859E
MTEDRCEAARPDDPVRCVGPHDAVTIIDARNHAVNGCEPHAARLLAALDDALLIPGSVADAPLRVRRTSEALRPFPWLTHIQHQHVQHHHA